MNKPRGKDDWKGELIRSGN